MSHPWKRFQQVLDKDLLGWALGLAYIVAVAIIWIAASYIVQSVVDAGVSPFLITYICNSLFVVYIPLVEVGRYLENYFGSARKQPSGDAEIINLLRESETSADSNSLISQQERDDISGVECGPQAAEVFLSVPDNEFTNLGTSFTKNGSIQSDVKGRWTRTQVAKVSLLICPFWFLAQLTFNLSLKFTTVTSNTILSSTSSLFTYLVAIVFLGETFTWVKLISVFLCMGGTIIVSLADSGGQANAIATNPLLGDVLAIVSAGLYAVYITLIRKKMPDEKKGEGQASMAQFLGFLGLFNLLIFLPVALVLYFAKLERFHQLSWEQIGLIVGKGLLDNVLSDYLWAKAILLTTTTVATAGLSIQVPIAAVVDSFTGHAPHFMDYIGATVVMVGFAGINIPSDAFSSSKAAQQEQEAENIITGDHHPHSISMDGSTATGS